MSITRFTIEDRLRILEKMNQHFQGYVHMIETFVERNLELVEDLLDTWIMPLFERIYIKTSMFTPSNAITRRRKHKFAELLFAVMWLEPETLRRISRACGGGAVHTLAELIGAIRTRDLASELLENLDDAQLLSLADKAMKMIAKAVRKRHSLVLSLVSPLAGFLNPLSRHIIDATMSYFLDEKLEGARIGIASPLGAGKTSLCFYSMYTAFRAMGVDPKLALEAAKAFIINDLYEILEFLYQVTKRRIFVPAVVLDDAAAAISKYWIYGSKEEKQIATRIFRALKISREGIGAIFLPADTKEALAKALRESVDTMFVGEKIKREGIVATLWIESERAHVLRAQPFKPKKLSEVREPHNLIATVHPPLYIPDDIYSALKEQKLIMREQLLEQAKELQKQLEERQRQEAEEEEIVEQEEIVEEPEEPLEEPEE